MGFNKCRFETSGCLQSLPTATFMSIWFALWNWGDRQPWNHIYHVLSSSSQSNRIWDLVNGDTVAGKISHPIVKQINTVGSDWIDFFEDRRNSFGQRSEAGRSRDKIAMVVVKIYIRHAGLLHTDLIGRRTTLNWQLGTLKLFKFTKTHGITMSCFDLVYRISHGTLYKISS